MVLLAVYVEKADLWKQIYKSRYLWKKDCTGYEYSGR